MTVAHRGGAGLAAENTLAAFARAHALGVRCLETDARMTADGRLVAFHDATLTRVTGVRGRVDAISSRDLARLRVLGGGAVPGMDELLGSFPDCTFIVDLKDRRCVAPLAGLLRDAELAARVCVAAPWQSWLHELRRRAGDGLTTALSWRALTRLSIPWDSLRRMFGSAGLETHAHLPLRLGGIPVFTNDVVRRAQDAGVRLLVWTVNDPVTMKRLLDLGVDGIITDRPDLLRGILVARGQWPVGRQGSGRGARGKEAIGEDAIASW